MPLLVPSTPQALAEHAECMAVLPDVDEERCVGYGVMGVAFESGHVLAFRRWPASSNGPGYTSIWHRLPDESWRVYTDAAASMPCARWLGGTAARVIEVPVRMSWTGPHHLLIEVQEAGLAWEVGLRARGNTRVFNLLRGLVPHRIAASLTGQRLMARGARRFLQLGRVMLRGTMPDGKAFRAVPRRLWRVETSQVTWEGADLGALDTCRSDARVGPITISTSGLFAFATARVRVDGKENG